MGTEERLLRGVFRIRERVPGNQRAAQSEDDGAVSVVQTTERACVARHMGRHVRGIVGAVFVHVPTNGLAPCGVSNLVTTTRKILGEREDRS